MAQRDTQKGREKILGVQNLGMMDVLDHAKKAAVRTARSAHPCGADSLAGSQ